MPCPFSPAKASPDNLIKTRLYLISVMSNLFYLLIQLYQKSGKNSEKKVRYQQQRAFHKNNGTD